MFDGLNDSQKFRLHLYAGFSDRLHVTEKLCRWFGGGGGFSGAGVQGVGHVR